MGSNLGLSLGVLLSFAQRQRYGVRRAFSLMGLAGG